MGPFVGFKSEQDEATDREYPKKIAREVRRSAEDAPPLPNSCIRRPTSSENRYNIRMGCESGHVAQYLGMPMAMRAFVPVTICGNRRQTGIQFVGRVRAIAHELVELGFDQGDVIAIAALNSDLYLEWLLGVMCAGCIVAPLNYRWSFEEASSAVGLVNPVMLVVDEFCLGWSNGFMDKFPTLRFHVFLGPQVDTNCRQLISAESIGRQTGGFEGFDFRWAPDSIALICFTSGTTESPKAVALSHTALIVQSLAKITAIGYNHDDVYLHTSPLCHIGGISSALALFMAGGCHVFIPKFEAASAVLAIQKHSVSAMITVPTMLADIVSHCKHSRSKGELELHFSTVKKLLNGAGNLSQELLEGTLQIFPTAQIFSAYGMTEACSSMTFMVVHDPALHRGMPGTGMEFAMKPPKQSISGIHNVGGVCVGKPAPHVELRIETSTKLFCENELQNVGNILTRGPHVMERYWGQEEATAAVLNKNGWLNTGDVGWMDKEGRLWLIGRFKDRIKSGGENVYPSEVEKVLLKHPGILAIAVVGIPDIRLNEVVTACIQLQDGWQWKDDELAIQSQSVINKDKILSPRLLQLYCKQQGLSGFKAPRIFIVQRESFPQTTTGKVKKDAVRTQALLRLQSQQYSLELTVGRSNL